MTNCDKGIYLESSDNSTFTYNHFQNNTDYGIFVSNDLCDSNIFHHNAFYINVLNLGTSQAYDDGTNSTWYDVTTNEGNFWNDHSETGNYSIDGGKFFDLYPLGETPIVPELNGNHFSAFFLLLIFVIPSGLIIKKRNRK